MKKLKLRRRYWRKRSGPRGRRQSEVCVIDENHDNLILHTILRHAPGIFQNIHDSFDEIDSKTLNNVYRKSTQPTRAKSGEPWPQSVILILVRTKFDTKYSDYPVLPGASFWEKDSPWPVTSSTLAETVSRNVNSSLRN